MHKQASKIAAFSMAWLFAFSLLSNCYCGPVMSSFVSSAQTKQCHQSKDKKCCTLKVQNDNFEKQADAVSSEKQLNPFSNTPLNTSVWPVTQNWVDIQPVLFESPPASYFLLHHAFLI